MEKKKQLIIKIAMPFICAKIMRKYKCQKDYAAVLGVVMAMPFHREIGYLKMDISDDCSEVIIFDPRLI